MGKILETIVKERLVYHLEKNNYFAPEQSGFRKNRQAMDNVVRLENDIINAKKKGKGVAAAFLDLEKAFDIMWRGGVLLEIDKIGISGQMFNYISDFLKDRTFQVKIGNSISDSRTQINGTPQGAVLSPILFNIAVNDVNKVAYRHGAEIGQHADDTAIWIKRGFTKKNEK